MVFVFGPDLGRVPVQSLLIRQVSQDAFRLLNVILRSTDSHLPDRLGLLIHSVIIAQTQERTKKAR